MEADLKPSKRARTRDQILIAVQLILMDGSAGSLGIRQVAERAGLVHASFYNYYADIDALLDGLGDLLLTTHALTVAPVRAGLTDPVALFATTTRQTLRLVPESPDFSRLLFDSGIAFDKLLRALQEPMKADLRAGLKSGTFKFESLDIAATMISGSMLSLAMDLHRKRAKISMIDDMTAQLLKLIGVPPAKARAAATAKIDFVSAPALPLSWRALGLAAPETRDAA
jgi:AcrR family transcriptional regulator